MKDLKDLFQLVAMAVAQNESGDVIKRHWFFDFSGHVNKFSIRYYVHGWSSDKVCDALDEKLTEEGIQSAYWFINSRLLK